jgi:hypothetical protein
MEVFMNRSLILLRLFLVVACSVFLTAQIPPNPPTATELIIGTWKQNLALSTYTPGPTPPGSGSVRQYAAGNDGSIVAVTMNLDAKGIPSLGAIAAANYDGREYVQHTVATLATSLGSHISPRISRTITYKPVDRYTVEILQKQDGQIVSLSTRTISRDGKTMTERSDFTNASGQRVNNVLVFEKQ